MRKRLISFALCAVMAMLFVAFPTGVVAEIGGWESSAAYADAPYFYGATRIIVPVGTDVDLKSGLFRLGSRCI